MSIINSPRRLRCYRYWAFDTTVDEELIWADVQSWGGSISIRGDCIDFFVPELWVTFFLLKYPSLVAQPSLDYL